MVKSNFETCPGIRKFVRPVPEFFPCPSCSGNVEIWSDEDSGICNTCSKEFNRSEKKQSCLDWCKYADKCREIVERARYE